MSNKSNINIQSDPDVAYGSMLPNRHYHAAKERFLMTNLTNTIERYVTVGVETSFLEIGFDNGARLKEMQKHYPNSHFVGLEVRDSCVATMVEEGYDCRLIKDELFTLDHQKFDVIYGFAVLHHISRPYDYLLHLLRLLKPGGIVLFQNEAHCFDFVSMVYITCVKMWKYENHLFKIRRMKVKRVLATVSREYSVQYDGMTFMPGFYILNRIYRMFCLHRLPFLNTLSILAQRPVSENGVFNEYGGDCSCPEK